MRIFYTISGWSIALSIIVILTIAATNENPIKINNQLHQEALENFSLATKELNESAVLYSKGKNDISDLRKEFKKTRTALKQMQMIGEYLDPGYYYWNFNGPPLPKLDPKATIIDPLDPNGLQALDEVIHEEDIDIDRMLELTGRLESSAVSGRNYQMNIALQPRFVFEAARFELIRILSLGITGFDTPASTYNAIDEAKTSFRTLEKHIMPWAENLNENDKQLADSISNKIDLAVKILNDAEDFNSLDRAVLTREAINPLFGMVTRAQRKLNLPTQYDISRLVKYSTNYLAEDIFSEDLFDPFYYTQITSKTKTENVVELGRTLFYDPILSENGDRACASCHDPSKAFTDGRAKSTAKDFAGTVDRNAPTLLNAVLSDKYFYDLRTNTVEGQVEHVIVNEKEFHTDYIRVIKRLESSPEYQELFKAAYPDIYGKPINQYTIAGSIAAFQTELISFDSEWDRYARGEKSDISPDVLAGYNIFMGKAACGTCHFAPTFSGLVPPLFHESESEVLGVPKEFDIDAEVLEPDPDIGRFGGVMKDQAEHYKHSFKTTTVRNAELTAPYMHNGAIATLKELMHFYNKGGGAGYGIDLEYQTLAPDPLGLTDEEISQVIAFMNSLTDTSKIIHPPTRLPDHPSQELAKREIGGEY
jgi:cytochrome c peroxidase